MRTRFTQAYKIQAVEKALTRSETTNLAETAESLGVGYSTLQKWIVQSRKQGLDFGRTTQYGRPLLVTHWMKKQSVSFAGNKGFIRIMSNNGSLILLIKLRR